MKKILCFLLALILGVTYLTACDNSSNAQGEGGRVIYDGGDGMDDGRLTIFRWNFAGINSARKSNTPVYKKLKEAANGLNLYSSSAGAGDWQTKLNTMFATQMLPDIFVSMGPETSSIYSDMIEDGVLVPVSDYVSETKYSNIYNHLKKFDYLKTNMYYSNGKHWGIPVDWTLEHTMYIRLDWLDNLNQPEKLRAIIADEQGISESSVTDTMMEKYKFTEPKDLLEFYRVCRAFTIYDPDGNGKNDTYGYTSAGGDDLFSDSWIFEAFGAGYNRMLDTDGNGTYESSWVTEETKKAIAYHNDLFKSGYIDPSWYESSTDNKQEAFAKGKVGMMEAHAWYNNIVRSFIAANTTANYKPSIEEISAKIGMFNPPKGENGNYGIPGNPNFWTFTCLNNGMSDEELDAALSLIDYMLSDEGKKLMIYGVEGVHYEVKDSGEEVSLLGKSADGFNKTLSEADACAEAASITSWSTSYLNPFQTNADKILNVLENSSTYNRYPDYPFLQTKTYVRYWDILQDYAEQEVFKLMCSSEIWTGSKTYAGGRKIPTSWSEIAVPSQKLDSLYANYVANYNKQGGTEVTSDYNTAIKTATKYSK